MCSLSVSQGDPGLPGLDGIVVSRAPCVDPSVLCQLPNGYPFPLLGGIKKSLETYSRKIHSVEIEQVTLPAFSR